jgi:hypothetical protein
MLSSGRVSGRRRVASIAWPTDPSASLPEESFGAKATCLATLAAAGLPVPSTFVIHGSECGASGTVRIVD